jgi:hypothetical protein
MLLTILRRWLRVERTWRCRVRSDDIEPALFFLDLFEEPIQIPELRM